MVGIPVWGCFACNVFAPFDSPTGDAQLISAARACLDDGDFRCAADYYGRLSGSSGDVAASETAFALLDRAGADFGSFSKAFVSDNRSSAGKVLTALAETLSLNVTPGASVRQAVLAAYKYALEIKAPELRGEVRFIAAIWLAAATLAEDAGAPGLLKATDIAANPATCNQQPLSSCNGSTACSNPGSKKLVTGPKITDLDTATSAQFGGPPSFYMIRAAMHKVSLGVNEMGTGDVFGMFFDQLTAPDIESHLPVDNDSKFDSPCFRWGLITGGVGE